MTIAVRRPVGFDSGGDRIAALLYPGTNGAAVVMGPGAGVTKEPGTDRFAARFHAAGFTVLALDFRDLGASGGHRPQVISPRRQRQDLRAAVRYARGLPDVDEDRVALWGFSLSAGHLLRPDTTAGAAAVIAQTPLADGLAAAPNALRHETVGVVNRMPLLALADLIGGALGRPPRVVPLAGPRGSVAMLSTPDAQDAERALDPDGRYPDWPRTVAARSVLRLLFYRPGRRASAVTAPSLVLIARDDCSVLAAPARRAARRMPAAEVVELGGGHYTAFLDEHETAVAAELDFLRRHLT